MWNEVQKAKEPQTKNLIVLWCISKMLCQAQNPLNPHVLQRKDAFSNDRWPATWQGMVTCAAGHCRCGKAATRSAGSESWSCSHAALPCGRMGMGMGPLPLMPMQSGWQWRLLSQSRWTDDITLMMKEDCVPVCCWSTPKKGMKGNVGPWPWLCPKRDVQGDLLRSDWLFHKLKNPPRGSVSILPFS